MSVRSISMIAVACLLSASDTHASRPEGGYVTERISQLVAAGTVFTPVAPFVTVAPTAETDLLWRDAASGATIFQMQDEVVTMLLDQRPLTIAFTLGARVFLLERADATTPDFRVRTPSGLAAMEYRDVHYRGIVQDEHASLVAISISQPEIMGTIHGSGGTLVLGVLRNAAPGTHVLYDDADLLEPPPIRCHTPEVGEAYPASELEAPAGRSLKCVLNYWEAAYEIYLDKGSVANAASYLTGLFNQVATLYDNDGMDIFLLELFVWDTPSPYFGATSEERLIQFGMDSWGFPGDVGHLLDYGYMGGIAYVDVLCSTWEESRVAYSGISSSFENLPAYSWSLMVVAHELGHNLGSLHTHSCVWNGNGTAIDGCGPTADLLYWDDWCPIAPVPSNGGTIMSYCHLLATGIDPTLGFGPQPSALMLGRINNAWCLGACEIPACTTCPTFNMALTATNSWQQASGSHGSEGCFTYKLNVVAGATYEFKTGCGNGAAMDYDTVIELLGPGCQLLAQDDNGCNDPGGASTISWVPGHTGVLYVRVKGASDTAAGSHTLAYRTTADNCLACTGFDQTISPADAWQTLSSGYANGGCKIFQVPMLPGITYVFKTGCGDGAGADHDTVLELLDPACGALMIDDNGCEAGRSIITYDSYLSGISLLLRVRGSNGVGGTFTLAYRTIGEYIGCPPCPSYDFDLDPTTDWQTAHSSHAYNGCRIYQVPVTAGVQYTFKTGCGNGATASYDTVMELMNGNCQAIAYDDDGCESYRSLIDWTATFTGTAYLLVAGYDGEGGNFTLAYRRGAMVTACNSCPDLDEIIDPETFWQITTAVNGVNGCKVYRVPVTTGTMYTFKTGCGDGGTADHDTVLELYDELCSLLYVDDNGCENGRSMIDWTATYDGYLYLKVRGNTGVGGSYTLAYKSSDGGGVACSECPAFDGTITPVEEWSLASASYQFYGCHVYQIPVTAGHAYVFQTGCGSGADADHDTMLQLYDAGCTPTLFNDDACGSVLSQISYTAMNTGFIYLKVFGYGGSGGSFTLAYRDLGADNDLCSTTVPAHLHAGDVLPIDGIITGATWEGDFVPNSIYHGFSVRWHSFQTFTCMDIRVSYCGNIPPLYSVLDVLATSCPADSLLHGVPDPDVCNNANQYLVYAGVQSGTYLLPVLYDPWMNVSAGYSIQVTGVLCSGMDVAWNTGTSWSLHPNPTSGNFTIVDPDGPDIMAVELLDMAGRVIKSWHGRQQNAHTYDAGSLSGGVYMVQVIASDGRRTSRRLVVQ